jgi:hypothetical protein
MSKTAYRYFAIEGGTLLERCQEIQAEWTIALKAASVFADTHGAKSFYTNANSLFAGPGSLIGLDPVSPLPKGWKMSRRRNFMEPRADAKELREAINALPKFPDTKAAISEAIGWNPNISEFDANGVVISSYGLPYAQLIWTGCKFCVVVPMHGLLGDNTAKTIAHAMALPVPDGCREITQAEWEMISATEQVAREKGHD